MDDASVLGWGILALMYFGDVVFAASGAFLAAQLRMDIVGFVLFATITGIGGGTLRDLLLDRTVWWTRDPLEPLLCAGAALVIFLMRPTAEARHRGLRWADAAGLAAFCVVGAHIALAAGVPAVVAVLMGVLTATGGGVIRDVIANRQPLITQGEVYATAALAGAATYVVLVHVDAAPWAREALAVLVAFGLRALGLVFHVRLGPPGRFLRIGGRDADS